jgi:hypothetical protein
LEKTTTDIIVRDIHLASTLMTSNISDTIRRTIEMAIKGSCHGGATQFTV